MLKSMDHVKKSRAILVIDDDQMMSVMESRTDTRRIVDIGD